MFSGCENIKSIEFSNFTTTNITNMSYMFYYCRSLKTLIGLSEWNTYNVNDMMFMFNGCKSLNSLSDISKWYRNKTNDKYKMNLSRIIITINIDKNQVNNKIYFLDNYYYDDIGDKIEQHDHLKELNEYNTELYINNKIEKYEKYFKPEKEGEYIIELRFNINLTDCSYMFSGCENIKTIEFSNFTTTNITNMSYMFYNCRSLKSLNGL